MTGTRRRVAHALVAGALVASCSSPLASALSSSPSGAPASTAPQASGSLDQSAAEQYCTDEGGMLVDRTATWNTNGDPSTWLPLAGHLRLCEFEMGTGDEATRISTDLMSLYSDQPTLASVAYLSKVKPVVPPKPGANPAEYNCREGLGGTATFGDGAAGGGWVDASQPVFVVMDLCVFEDMSAIDAFGLLYHQEGTIRGADLATKMRYRPGNELPAIFGN